ncbi:MAG TPA: hypothetical protein VKZ97_05850, partial [Flavobacteriaceae bacterium]|nr:hypothetical protein [Flavobacteriaceae bacterium]
IYKRSLHNDQKTGWNDQNLIFTIYLPFWRLSYVYYKPHLNTWTYELIKKPVFQKKWLYFLSGFGTAMENAEFDTPK